MNDYFSTPSLGITHDEFGLSWKEIARIFNSLSRDHRGDRPVAEQALNQNVFNSLSRDHWASRDGSGEKDTIDFSTPSLGITEPDSGIFRLSAAFCRGTSSHK